jgi:small GTP-binding protein
MDNRYYKLCIVGESNVGKSSIAERYVNHTFNDYSTTTIGAAYFSKLIQYNNSNLHLQIWDTAGQERYRSITPLYYRNAAAVILVLDQTCVKSNTLLDYWIPAIKEHIPDIPIFIAINKCDLPSNLSNLSIDSIAEKYSNVKHTFVSAKTNQGILELFNDIVQTIYHDKNIPVTSSDTITLVKESPPTNWYNKCSIL